MGRKAQHVSKRDALNYVAGYATGNEVSERAFLLEHGGLQWIMGKSPDTFAPLGPWLVTSDEVGNPQKLNLWLEVNGKRYQDESTADMIFNQQYEQDDHVVPWRCHLYRHPVGRRPGHEAAGISQGRRCRYLRRRGARRAPQQGRQIQGLSFWT
jgi:hypothetical protein